MWWECGYSQKGTGGSIYVYKPHWRATWLHLFIHKLYVIKRPLPSLYLRETFIQIVYLYYQDPKYIASEQVHCRIICILWHRLRKTNEEVRSVFFIRPYWKKISNKRVRKSIVSEEWSEWDLRIRVNRIGCNFIRLWMHVLLV